MAILQFRVVPVSRTDDTINAPGNERAYPEAQKQEPEPLDGQGEGERRQRRHLHHFSWGHEYLSGHAVSHEPISFFLFSKSVTLGQQFCSGEEPMTDRPAGPNFPYSSSSRPAFSRSRSSVRVQGQKTSTPNSDQ